MDEEKAFDDTKELVKTMFGLSEEEFIDRHVRDPNFRSGYYTIAHMCIQLKEARHFEQR